MTPARAVRDRAEAIRADKGEAGFATDATGDPVLIGIATPRSSCVLAVAKAEFDAVTVRDWRKVASAMGFPLKDQTAFDRAKKAKAA